MGMERIKHKCRNVLHYEDILKHTPEEWISIFVRIIEPVALADHLQELGGVPTNCVIDPLLAKLALCNQRMATKQKEREKTSTLCPYI